jgi:hypothetical protein
MPDGTVAKAGNFALEAAVIAALRQLAMASNLQAMA